MGLLKISRILHAGYLFEHAGARVAFDPVFENPFSRNCFAFPAVRFDHASVRALRLDAVFISHHHEDHLSLESLALLDRATPIHLFCAHAEMFDWIRRLGFTAVHALRLDAPVDVGAIRVTARRALDADLDSIFDIAADGARVLNVVDSWIDDETLSCLAETDWDLVLWPFQTMRELEVLTPTRPWAAPEIPPEWRAQLRRLRPRYLVPSSCQFRMEEWSWYNQAFFPISYAFFAREVSREIPETRVWRLNPGQAIEWDGRAFAPAPPLPWVRPEGEQDVDYRFDPPEIVPSTAEIARRFSALDAREETAVARFLGESLPRRLAELGPSADPFFRRRRTWRLDVYDCEGIATSWDFSLDEERATAITGAEKVDWRTEISARKLYGAIAEGESLTSLYVRVSAESAEIDPLEDPLLRALYNGVFGAYQRAQLEKILGAQV